MDYNKIHTFLEVAKEGSITKVSAKLYLTQQAVSKQIQSIEKDLNLKLFNRANNSIVLTKDGQELVGNLSAPYEKINEYILKQQGDLKSSHGVIKIGISVQSTRNKYLDLISSFKGQFPNVKFEINFDIDSSIEKKLLSNELDFGIIFLYRDKRILTGSLLEESEAVISCTKEYYKTYGPFKVPTDLIGVPFVAYSNNFRTFGTWVKKNSYKRMKPFFDQKADIIVENDDSISYMICRGTTIGVIKKNTFLKLKDEFDLIELFPKSKKLTIGIDLVHKKKESDNFIENKFREFLLENC